jgi:hypothetical protein
MKDHVRMKLNRNLHAQFKLMNGGTNDERMSNLLADSWLNFRLVKDVNYHKETARQWRSASAKRNATTSTTLTSS